MVMIKENHIEIAGSIKAAVEAVRSMHGGVHVEVEARDLKEVNDAVENGADRVLLDNMTPEMVTRAIELVAGRCLIEVSGGVNLTNIDSYLLPGVDAISIGALTHSAPAIDLSLEVELPRTRSN
jgi:nicotinate-nucleotide pyrophosphorylase (carboxylating)